MLYLFTFIYTGNLIPLLVNINYLHLPKRHAVVTIAVYSMSYTNAAKVNLTAKI